MHYIISNPHNGSDIDFDGVALPVGYQVALNERDAQALHARFPFLMLSVVEKTTLKLRKPRKLKEDLAWGAANHGSDLNPAADHVEHTIAEE